jgi:geranylgeranyl pyrophosphate synthase
MHELNSFFAEVSENVNKTLDRLIPSAETEPQKLHEAIRWSVFGGGKRFRPALVFAVGRTFGAPDQKFVRTAAAIEMIHTYSLIHDDLPAMDDDDLRRGRATCHVKYGEATAILAGDVLQTLAFKAIADDVNLSDKMRVRLISEIAAASGTPNGMVAGQQLDLDAEGESKSIAEIEKIHRGKTGELIRISAVSGAIIGAARELDIDAISEYGAKLGLLFQITDDLLDATQPTAVLGKTAGKDAKTKKATYTAAYGPTETKHIAGEVRLSAIDSLSVLKNPAAILIEIANHILERSY